MKTMQDLAEYLNNIRVLDEVESDIETLCSNLAVIDIALDHCKKSSILDKLSRTYTNTYKKLLALKTLAAQLTILINNFELEELTSNE